MTKLYMMIELDVRKTFTGSAPPPAVAKSFCDTNADMRSADLLVYIVLHNYPGKIEALHCYSSVRQCCHNMITSVAE